MTDRLLLCIALIATLSCDRSGRNERVRVTVFAAASLREAFGDIAAQLKRSDPNVDVVFNFAGTQELRAQLEHGAAADVLASADRRQMDELLRQGLVKDPVELARNEPVVVAAKGASITTFSELPTVSRVVLGATDVPIGRYSAQLLDRAGADFRSRVEAHVISHELNVKQVLAKVRLGEADAAIVYRTDVTRNLDGVRVIPIPREVNVIAEYPIALVSAAPHPLQAKAFIAAVMSPSGQQLLKAAGFSSPAGTDEVQ